MFRWCATTTAASIGASSIAALGQAFVTAMPVATREAYERPVDVCAGGLLALLAPLLAAPSMRRAVGERFAIALLLGGLGVVPVLA